MRTDTVGRRSLRVCAGYVSDEVMLKRNKLLNGGATKDEKEESQHDILEENCPVQTGRQSK